MENQGEWRIKGNGGSRGMENQGEFRWRARESGRE